MLLEKDSFLAKPLAHFKLLHPMKLLFAAIKENGFKESNLNWENAWELFPTSPAL